MQNIKVADVTLIESEKTAALNFKEKIEVVKEIDRLNVSIIETELVRNRKTYVLFLHTIVPLEKNSTISCPIELSEESVEITADAIKGAEKKRLHVMVPTSSVQMEYLCHKNSKAILENSETPEQTVKNLSAYIKHIHIKDSDGRDSYSMVGEGSLLIPEIMNALRSINYNEFMSIEWDPEWDSEISDMDIIFQHFVSYMSRYENLSRKKSTLYENRAGTGKVVWKKDSFIEKTFSQVLDKMVEEFPDQLAFKYTTLDYTRTYLQFRDDVDTFARSLVSMGGKVGSHVAIWATNVPQWYIAFWATTKIGAVLVTVNTAYKIHKAEYLMKQAHTHTLIMIEGYRDSNYSAIMAELCPELGNTKKGEQLHSRRLPFLRNIITVGYEQKGCITWEDAIRRAFKVSVEEIRRMAAAVNINDVCNMQYTSDTTGFPKGVMLTHYNVVNNGKCIGDRMDLSTADRLMIQVPMFHCFGMVLAMPKIECKIVDPATGEDLPDNVTGEFVARGYNIMKEYYKMPVETANTIDKDGWLHTGDLALRTPEGNYRITGRLKDRLYVVAKIFIPRKLRNLYTIMTRFRTCR